MPAIQASRRLVKSPPELWAEVSDAASLARHLGEVGEITITRLEAETTVAWEGERASGTVELAPAGWGTSVTLTAAPTGEVEAPAESAPEAEPAPKATAEPGAVAEPESAAAAPAPDPEPATEPEPMSIEEPAPAAAPARRGWLARLFSRKPKPAATPEPATSEPPTPSEPEPSATHADRAGGGEDARPAAERRTGAHPEPSGPARQAAEPEADPLLATLTSALDSLGQAHHRPFSRG